MGVLRRGVGLGTGERVDGVDDALVGGVHGVEGVAELGAFGAGVVVVGHLVADAVGGDDGGAVVVDPGAAGCGVRWAAGGCAGVEVGGAFPGPFAAVAEHGGGEFGAGGDVVDVAGVDRAHEEDLSVGGAWQNCDWWMSRGCRSSGGPCRRSSPWWGRGCSSSGSQLRLLYFGGAPEMFL